MKNRVYKIHYGGIMLAGTITKMTIHEVLLETKSLLHLEGLLHDNSSAYLKGIKKIPSDICSYNLNATN